MSVSKIMAAMVAVVGLAAVGLVFAQGSSSKAEGDVALPAEKGIEAVVTGENICLGCALKKEKGAGAQCSIYGHKHALRVTSATVGGKDMPDMKGWVLHYLETQKSEDLIKQHHGESLTIIGKVYPNERVLEVTSSKSEQPKSEQPKKSEHPEHPK